MTAPDERRGGGWEDWAERYSELAASEADDYLRGVIDEIAVESGFESYEELAQSGRQIDASEIPNGIDIDVSYSAKLSDVEPLVFIGKIQGRPVKVQISGVAFTRERTDKNVCFAMAAACPEEPPYYPGWFYGNIPGWSEEGPPGDAVTLDPDYLGKLPRDGNGKAILGIEVVTLGTHDFDVPVLARLHLPLEPPKSSPNASEGSGGESGREDGPEPLGGNTDRGTADYEAGEVELDPDDGPLW